MSAVGQAKQPEAVQMKAAEITPVKSTLTVKVSSPNPFDGNRRQLKMFLTQLDLYIGFNRSAFDSEASKVLFAASYLRGGAFDWFETFISDYMEHQGNLDRAKKGTREVFTEYADFKEKIKKVFGDIDEERTAERNLQNLTQKSSVASYAAEFQQYAARTEWDENALTARFYQGLKDRIKDDIARGDRPEDLEEMIETAVRIDTRQFERSLEKKSTWTPTFNKGRHQKKSHWPQPMELDATFGQNNISQGEKERRSKERLCYTCGKPGHQARNCTQNKGKKSWKKGKQLNATWQGQLNATSNTNLVDWEVTDKELEEPCPTDWEFSDNESKNKEEQSNVSPCPPSTEDPYDMESKDEKEEKQAFQCKEYFDPQRSIQKIERPYDLGFEHGDMTEIDHPRHTCISWKKCYIDTCDYHFPLKKKYLTFPTYQGPIYRETYAENERRRQQEDREQAQDANTQPQRQPSKN